MRQTHIKQHVALQHLDLGAGRGLSGRGLSRPELDMSLLLGFGSLQQLWSLDYARFRHSTPLSVFVVVPPPVAVVVVAHSSVASVASLPAPASLMLDRSSRRLSGAPHAPAKPFDQKLTSALCAVWWKECAIDVSLHTHRYECIYHRYLLRHRPICHHVRWLVCDSSLTLTAWR